MEPAPNVEIRSVDLVIPDKLVSSSVSHLTRQAFPRAELRTFDSVSQARLAHVRRPGDLFVTTLGHAHDDDILTLIFACEKSASPLRRVLAVTATRDAHLLAILRDLDVLGAFDSTVEEPQRLAVALQTVAHGAHYWSKSILAEVAELIGPGSLYRRLTAFERRVLAAIGSGNDDRDAASELGLSPATIATVRRDLHRKLDVRHRGELVRLAAQQGFVRFLPRRVSKPGSTVVAASYQSKKPRPLNALAA